VLAAVAASVLAFAASGVDAADTDLRVRAWPDGRGEGQSKTWTLECAPARGTLPRRDTACRRLAGAQRPFAPPPKDMQCTLIYGGPAEALVTGTYRGRKVWALLTLRDGCQIDRWRRVAFLTPGFGTPGS
jgi:Subtilisin inhibitor-like